MVQKRGHSLVLRIPKRMAEHIKIKEGLSVDITECGDTLLVRPSKTKVTLLKELLLKIKPECLHGEIKTGYVVGKEAW